MARYKTGNEDLDNTTTAIRILAPIVLIAFVMMCYGGTSMYRAFQKGITPTSITLDQIENGDFKPSTFITLDEHIAIFPHAVAASSSNSPNKIDYILYPALSRTRAAEVRAQTPPKLDMYGTPIKREGIGIEEIPAGLPVGFNDAEDMRGARLARVFIKTDRYENPIDFLFGSMVAETITGTVDNKVDSRALDMIQSSAERTHLAGIVVIDTTEKPSFVLGLVLFLVGLIIIPILIYVCYRIGSAGGI